MTIVFTVTFVVLLILLGALLLVNTGLKENNSSLLKLNSKLNEDITELQTKNAMLHSDLISRNEERVIDVGKEIKWLDKHKEFEIGSVLDDYKHNGKVYVVVIRMKDGKTQGAPISIPYEKLILS
jgi:hypothetical protein